MEVAREQFTADGLEVLAPIRHFVDASARTVCDDLDAVAELIIAVNEAVTNVIVHGYEGQPGPVEIAVEGDSHNLIVRIRDQAPRFDPTSVPRPDLTLPLEKRTYGGMGVHMMREFVDNLTYRPAPSGGNELTLEKKTTR